MLARGSHRVYLIDQRSTFDFTTRIGTGSPGRPIGREVSTTIASFIVPRDAQAEQENQRPVITGQSDLTTPEDVPFVVSFSDIAVDDPDNNYPADFTLRLSAGAHYSADGNAITPDQDFSGMLVVHVVVNDGQDDSPPFDLHVAVESVNDPPVISGQVPLSTAEGQAITIGLDHLTIEDPDNITFTLSILPGPNYSVSGNIVTPASGYSGSLTVPVVVSDGAANSDQFNLVIEVTAVNDRPAITGQRPIEVAEDTPFVLSLADITVEDGDNNFPSGFTLRVAPGEHYTFSGTTVNPAVDFSGPLQVNIIVNDGENDSEPFPLAVTVTPVNDAPVIANQHYVATNEETARTLALRDLVVSDPDNQFPEDFSLMVFAGDNYTLDGHVITPVADFSGAINVPVQVSDGELVSNVFVMTVNVTPANDKPVITGQVPLETDQGIPITIALAHLTVLDADNAYPQDFTLKVLAGAHYTVSETTVYPMATFVGTLNVPVVVNDGLADSKPFALQIHVGNVNGIPMITGQRPVATDEEQPVTLTLSHFDVVDPDNSYPAGFSLLISPGTNYTVTGETIMPAKDFFGLLTIPVRVNDGANNSPAFDFKLQVNPINDPPSFAAIPDQQIAENATSGSIVIKDISKGPQEDDQQLTFVSTSGNTAVINDPVVQYDGKGTTATLTYTVRPNASGVVTLTVVAIDNGPNTAPHQNSYAFSFRVEVMEINLAPTLQPVSNITILEDAEQQNITLAGISAGAGESQVLTVSATSDKPELFDLLEVAYTSPETTALLRFRPRANASGSTTITVTVTDDGPGNPPHKNTVARKFLVTIQPVNDPPVFDSQPLTVAVAGGQYEYKISVTDPDGDKIRFSAPVKPQWATLSSGNNNEARLHGRPPESAIGSHEVVLVAKDAGEEVEQRFTVYVNSRPSLLDISTMTDEDTELGFSVSFFGEAYSDKNGNPMQAIQIASVPAYGELSLSDVTVRAGDTISVSSIGQLVYKPEEDFFGRDAFSWNAFDGYHFGAKPARVDVDVHPVNDPPRVILQSDTLHYEVDGVSALLSPGLEIRDPDDDTLSHATIRFHSGTYRPQMDILEYQVKGGISGRFDVRTGVLELTGVAPIDDYRDILRSIRYTHLNTVDPILEFKGVTYRVDDSDTEGEEKEKVVILQYTFVEFDIPSAFTPNGDQANDTWVIDRPGGGLEDMNDAIISVYNKQGVLVFRTKGFEKPWDGTMNGEMLPADTYFFIIDLQLRSKKTYRGIVTILR